MPANPQLLQLICVPALRHQFSDRRYVKALSLLPLLAPLSLPVVPVERRQDLCQLFLRLRIIWSGKARRQFQQQPLARQFQRKLQRVKAVRLFRILRARGIQHLACIRRNLLGVLSDEILLHPACTLRLQAKIKKFLLCLLDKLLPVLGRWRGHLVATLRSTLLRPTRVREEASPNRHSKQNSPFHLHPPKPPPSLFRLPLPSARP